MNRFLLSSTTTLPHTTSPAMATLSPTQTVPPTNPVVERYADVEVAGMLLIGDLLSLTLSKIPTKDLGDMPYKWLGTHMDSLGWRGSSALFARKYLGKYP